MGKFRLPAKKGAVNCYVMWLRLRYAFRVGSLVSKGLARSMVVNTFTTDMPEGELSRPMLRDDGAVRWAAFQALPAFLSWAELLLTATSMTKGTC